MPIQIGVGLQVAYRKETAYGVLPVNDAQAKDLRRTKSGLTLAKDAIRSEEIRPDYQVVDMRHGMRKVEGPLDGELSLGTYADFIGSAVRRLFAAMTFAGGALTNITAAATAPHFVRAAGSWITDGLRVGMTIRMSGWTTTATANNARNYTITALTATQMTLAEPVVAKAAGDSITITIPGKGTFVPTSGHVNESYAIEHWAPDAGHSQRFLGCRVNTVGLNMPPNEKATISIGFMGRDRVTAATEYFSSAVAVGTNGIQTGLSGLLLVNGTAVGLLTSLSINLNNNCTTQGVVGSNTTPDVFPGRCDVSGSFSVLYDSATFDGFFDSEAQLSLIVKFNNDTGIGTDFMTLVLPRIKLAGGQMQDSQQAIVQSFEFTGLRGDGSNGFESTTLWLQDSLA